LILSLKGFQQSEQVWKFISKIIILDFPINHGEASSGLLEASVGEGQTAAAVNHLPRQHQLLHYVDISFAQEAAEVRLKTTLQLK
jgi:hypothetical protein